VLQPRPGDEPLQHFLFLHHSGCAKRKLRDFCRPDPVLQTNTYEASQCWHGWKVAIRILLEETSALRCLFMSSLIKRAQIRIDGAGWDLRSEDHNVERGLLPREVGSCSQPSDRLDDLGPLSSCQR
jgi:hypothetical protein